MSADSIARRSAEAMWRDDAASHWFGMRLVEIGEGRAIMTLEVLPHHCNGHGALHGGVTFALADSAFAFACNSRNERTVAQENSITYVAPGRAGDVLTATAEEVFRKGRTGLYDVRVTREDGTLIAAFRGLARAVGGTLYTESPTGDGDA